MGVYNKASEIANEIAARLALRTIANGAETDLGVKVYRGRRHVDDTMIPCCVLIEGDDVPSAGNKATIVQLAQRYVLFAYVPCDPNNPNDAAHAALRDMKKAIFTKDGKPDSKLGDSVRSVEYLGRDIGPRADGAAFVLAAIEIGVSFLEDLSDP